MVLFKLTDLKIFPHNEKTYLKFQKRNDDFYDYDNFLNILTYRGNAIFKTLKALLHQNLQRLQSQYQFRSQFQCRFHRRSQFRLLWSQKDAVFLGRIHFCTTKLGIWQFFGQETYIPFVAQETIIIRKLFILLIFSSKKVEIGDQSSIIKNMIIS